MSLKKFVDEKIKVSSKLKCHDVLYQNCLNEISKHPIDNLQVLKNQLISEQDRLRQQIKQLAAANYSTFLSKVNATQSVLDDLSSVCQKNDQVHSQLIPNLLTSSNLFVEAAEDIMRKSLCYSQALEKHNQMCELLELPQLINLCIRNDYFDDALSVLRFITELDKSHGEQVKIIHRLANEIQKYGGLLLLQLCGQLEGQINLPTCLNTIVYLRRMNILSDQELRLKFLLCRSKFLHSGLRGELSTNKMLFGEVKKSTSSSFSSSWQDVSTKAHLISFHRLVKRLEVTRMRLFDTISQYKAVFIDEVYTTPSDIATLHQINNPLLNLTGENVVLHAILSPFDSLRQTDGGGGSPLYHSWLLYELNACLEKCLVDLAEMVRPILTAGGDDSTEESASSVFGLMKAALTHLTHFGTSFSRFGYDLTPLISYRFLSLHKECVNAIFNRAVTNFGQQLDALPWRQLMEEEEGGKSTENGNNDEVAPPKSLLAYPPLVGLCNDLLECLNGIRLCLPTGCVFKVVRSLKFAFQLSAQQVMFHYRVKLNIQPTNWKNDAAALVREYSSVLVPHIYKCLLVHILQFDGQNATALSDFYALYLNSGLDTASLSYSFRDYQLNLILESNRTLECVWHAVTNWVKANEDLTTSEP